MTAEVTVIERSEILRWRERQNFVRYRVPSDICSRGNTRATRTMEAMVKRKEHDRTKKSAASENQPDLTTLNFYPSKDFAGSLPSMLSERKGKDTTRKTYSG